MVSPEEHNPSVVQQGSCPLDNLVLAHDENALEHDLHAPQTD